MISVPPEDLMGADKLFAEARFGSARGPLKLGAFRNSWVGLSAVGWISFSNLLINRQEPNNFNLVHMEIQRHKVYASFINLHTNVQVQVNQCTQTNFA